MRTLRLTGMKHDGNQGQKDFPLHKAPAVKEMFDSLSTEGFRPMIIGYSSENPFPELGGKEPPPPPKKQEPKRATTWSNSVAGHSESSTPHDRIMSIIRDDDEKEAIWEEASRRLSERCGRAGMGEITRRWPFTGAAYPDFELNVPSTGCLKRDFTPWIMNYFAQQSLVDHVLSQPDYTSFAFAIENVPSFDSPNIHGSGHFGVGGVLPFQDFKERKQKTQNDQVFFTIVF